MKKRFRNLIFLTAALLLVVSAYFISQTYAKYISTAGARAQVNIAKWHILVNNTHITSGTNISNTIAPLFPGNEHIREGIIAPTAEGYFDLNLDFVEVDVSFKYEVTIDISALSAVADLDISAYSLDGGSTRIDFTESEKKIEESIPLTSNIGSRSVRVFVSWNDDSSTEIMDNAADTLATTDPNNRAVLNVGIAFTQITE